jgi:RNA polymerase sigma factor (sigma-70 family)
MASFPEFPRSSNVHHLPGCERAKPPVEVEDESVVSGKNQKELFNQVVLPHLGDALALARWLTGNATDAEDVVQDACIKAYAGLAGYAGGNARAWLLTIVRNASYTWLSRNRARGLMPVGDLSDLDDFSVAQGVNLESGENQEASLIARADAAALEAAIAALPEPFRETLVLRDINGLSYREIADMLDVPIGTIMSRLARARAQLISDLGRAR